jgi:hypothetical protein
MEVAVRFVPAYWPRFRQLSGPMVAGRYSDSKFSIEVVRGVREAVEAQRMASSRLALELSRVLSNLY